MVAIVSITRGSLFTSGSGSAAGVNPSTLKTNGESAAAASSAFATASDSLWADSFISPKILFMASSAEISSGASVLSGNLSSFSGAFWAAGWPAISPNMTLPSEGAAGATGTAKGSSGVRLTKPASAIAFAAAPTSPPSTVDSRSSWLSLS